MSTLTTIRATPPNNPAPTPSPNLDAIPPFIAALKPQNPRLGLQAWIPALPHYFRRHPQLELVAADRYATRAALLPAHLDVYLLTYEEVAGRVLDGLGGGCGDRLRALVEGAREEGRAGVGWGMERLVVVGRKRGAGAGAGAAGGVLAGCQDGMEGGAEASVAGAAGDDGAEEKASAAPVVLGECEGEGEGSAEGGRKGGRGWWVRVWKRLRGGRFGGLF